MSSLAAYTYTYNCERIKYPYKACIESALSVADEVFWCDCGSTDGTHEVAAEWASRDKRLHILNHDWGTHFSIQPKICNHILREIGTRFDWSMLLQGDEVAAEWTFHDFRSQLDHLPSHIQLARPHYTNFCPDPWTTWPFIYDRKAVICRTGKGIRWDTAGDACSLAGLPQADVGLEIFHYGKVQLGREREALHKELTFQELYRSKGFPDPKFVAQQKQDRVDYPEAFAGATFTPYTGPHPSFAGEWIAEREYIGGSGT